MLRVHAGVRTEAGLRENIRVGVRYVAAWLGGRGAVPLYNLMEDAATAEISRAQLWQWARHRAPLDDGRTVTRELVLRLLREEAAALQATGSAEADLERATALFEQLVTADDCPEFLTLPAYRALG
jgi:malate synthase